MSSNLYTVMSLIALMLLMSSLIFLIIILFATIDKNNADRNSINQHKLWLKIIGGDKDNDRTE